jgi:excisionase family DNA binding protein
MDKLLLRPDEAAELLGLGRSKLYALLKSGALPSVRLGGAVRVPAEALRRWVAQQTTGTSPGASSSKPQAEVRP